MKKLSLAIVALFCLVAFSCHKENDIKPNDFFIGANVADSNWLAKPTTNYVANNDSLQIQGSPASGNSNLVIRIKFSGVGTYTLTSGQASFDTMIGPVGGSGPVVNYQLDNTKTNTVTITQYNPQTQIATGSFQLNFVKGSIPSPGNTLSLSNGKFWLALPGN